MNQFFIVMSTIAVIGVVVSEAFLIYAMVRPNEKITTRKVGRYIMFFLLLLTVSVTAAMFLNR